MLEIQQFTVGLFAETTYLLVCSDSRNAILVDPGDEADLLWQAITDAKADLEAIVLTHAHLDHVGAVEAIRHRAKVPVYLHPADDELLANVPFQGRLFGIEIPPVAPADRTLAHGERIAFGDLELEVRHTPGHSPGGVCLYIATERALIAGDTLFHRGVGRTDLPGGDAQTLFRSIEDQLWPLPPDVTVYPGHGPQTTIGAEREGNPFVGKRASWGIE
jgi:hydroxyacylglutathione hydrolase